MANRQQNESRLKSKYENDPEMRELIELFVEELPERMGTIVSAWENRNLDTLRRMAHQLRGASGGYGYPTIGEAAGKLEEQLKGLQAADDTALEGVANGLRELTELCRRATMRH